MGSNMSEREADLETKVKELEEKLQTLEHKFHRSDDRVRVKTLLCMQKRTHDFLIWLVRRDIEREKAKA